MYCRQSLFIVRQLSAEHGGDIETVSNLFKRISAVLLKNHKSVRPELDELGNTIADYVINGTVEEVVPKMIKYYKQNSK